MPNDEWVGFVPIEFKEPGSLDGPACKCGAIMVRVSAAECDGVPFWSCQDCGATTGCTDSEGK